jgi:hypothetical protein
MHKFLIFVLGVLAGGAGGYIPLSQQYKARQAAAEKQLTDLRQELAGTRQRARLAELTARLGGVMVKVDEGDFAMAREKSTPFFDALREARAATPAGQAQQALAGVLARRDEITSDLAMSNQRAAPKLREMFTNLQALLE